MTRSSLKGTIPSLAAISSWPLVPTISEVE
jgi:hypothetical protein